MIAKLSSWSLISLPFAIVSGPFLPDLIMSFLAIYALFLSRKPELRFYYKHPLVRIILFFWAYCIFRSLLSSNPILSLEASLFYGRFIFFSLAVAFLINQNKQTLIFFGWSLVICLFLVTSDAYLQFFTGENILGWKPDPAHKRLSGIFGDELVLGSFLARLMPLGFFVLASIPRLKSWMVICGLSFLIAVDVLIFLAGERVGFFYLMLGTVLIIVLISRFRWLRFFTFLASSLVIIVLTITLPQVKSRMVDQTISDFGLSDTTKSLHIFTPTHEEHYTNALKMFYDNPIFGQGPKLFRYLCNKREFYPIKIENQTRGCSTHPHNTYIQLLSELGILGTLPVLGLFLYLIYLFGKQFFSLYFKRKDPLFNDPQICLLIMMFISLWPLIPTGNFFGNSLNVFYYLPIGFYLYKTSK